MTTNFLRAWFALTIAVVAAGAADLSVRVVDPHQAAIPAAEVALIPKGGSERLTLTTDASGSCRFQAVAPGQYFVAAEAPGFQGGAPQPVDLKNGGTVALTLSLGVAQVHSSVVVTASGTPQTTDEVSKALTVVDGATIGLRAYRSVAEALADVPGMRVEQLGGPLSPAYFKMRGLRETGDTAVLVDGLRLRDASGTQADASDLLQDLVLTDTSRIEVLRGAGSSLYGTDATGGVVNIVTDAGGGRTRGSLAVDGGSLGAAGGTAHLAGGFRQDRIQYSLGATHWNIMSGVEGDSPARNTSGQGQVTFRLSPSAWLSARFYGGDTFSFVRITPQGLGVLPATGIIRAIPLSLSEQRRYEAGTPLERLALGSATYLPAAFDSDSTLAARFFTGAFQFAVRPSDRFGFTAQYQDLSAGRDFGDGPAGPGYQPSGSNLSRYVGNIQTANARIDASLGRFQHFDAGYEFENENFQNRLAPPAPVSSSFTDVSQRSNSVFAQDQIRLADGRLQLAASYRAQFFSLQQPRFEPLSGAPFAGANFAAPPAAQTADLSAAYTIRRTGTKFRSHAGRGYRAPSLYERFGAYFDGMNYTLYGSPELRPDRSTSIDGGIDQMLWNSRVQLSATYFYTRLEEVIFFDLSLGIFGGYRNTGGGLARGVEFSAAVAATRSLQLTGSYTYTDAREETPMAPGVWQSFETPRHQYSMFATQRFSPRWNAVFGYIGSTSYFGSISDLAFRFDGPSRAQATLSYRRPLSEFRALRFYGRADNLFNQTYFEYGFRTPGVTLMCGTQFEF